MKTLQPKKFTETSKIKICAGCGCEYAISTGSRFCWLCQNDKKRPPSEKVLKMRKHRLLDNELIKIGMKKCTICGEVKPISEFYLSYVNDDGEKIFKSRCKPCTNYTLRKKLSEKIRSEHTDIVEIVKVATDIKIKLRDINKIKSQDRKARHRKRLLNNELISKGVRVCRCCDKELPLSDFHKTTNGNYDHKCKYCCAKTSSLNYYKDRVPVRQSSTETFRLLELGQKLCSSCKQILPVDQFYRNEKNTKTRLMSYCKHCLSQKSTERKRRRRNENHDQ